MVVLCPGTDSASSVGSFCLSSLSSRVLNSSIWHLSSIASLSSIPHWMEWRRPTTKVKGHVEISPSLSLSFLICKMKRSIFSSFSLGIKLPTPVFWPGETHELSMGLPRVGHDRMTFSLFQDLKELVLMDNACKGIIPGSGI